MFQIVGQRITLKNFNRAHLESDNYVNWLQDPDVVLTIYRSEYLLPQPPEKIRQYAQNLIDSDNDVFFAVHLSEGDRFVGTARIGHINWRAGLGDIGVLVGDRTCWGKGVATEAVSLACKYGFEYLSLRKLTGGTTERNAAMRKCFEKLGFVTEGVLRKQILMKGDYEDHILYGLFPAEFKSLAT